MGRAVLFVFAFALAAQEPRFDVRSRLVQVPVTVTDSKGRFIDGLQASDFQVLDNGRPQQMIVDTIATGVAPIALVIAVQSSGISVPVLEKVRKIGVMIQPVLVGESGCAALLSFSDRVAWLQECTNDPDALAQAFNKLRPGEEKKGRMLDAAEAAIRRLRGRPGSRRVLLLISESRDRGSETDLSAVTAAAQSIGVTVYAATYSAIKTAFTSQAPLSDPPRPIKPKTPNDNMETVDGNPPSKYNPRVAPPEQRVDVIGGLGELARLGQTNAAQALAGATGGTTVSFARQKGLEEVIAKLGAELHSQYVLSFVPEAKDPGYHNLEVKLARSGRFRIRARPGYWSAAESQ
jgi:VWFA-related protein